MKIKTGDSLNSAIQKVCEKSAKAGSIVVLIQRECPADATMEYLRAMDQKGLYGEAISEYFFGKCSANLDDFLANLTDGRVR